jgi:hypothetical protein
MGRGRTGMEQMGLMVLMVLEGDMKMMRVYSEGGGGR